MNISPWELTDPRLRAATVAWVAARTAASDRNSRSSAVVFAWTVLGRFAWRQARARDRAVRLNSDQPGWSPSGAGPDGDRVAHSQRE